MDSYNGENSMETPSASIVNPHQYVPKKKHSKASRSRTVDPSAKRRKDKSSPSRKTARNNKDQVHERSIIEEHAYSM